MNEIPWRSFSVAFHSIDGELVFGTVRPIPPPAYKRSIVFTFELIYVECDFHSFQFA